MKNILIFILSLFLGVYTAFSQDDLLFESTLYFEDAIGNQDSIVFGFAENEEIHFINPIYGEVELSAPFDSIFEVRASHDKTDSLNPYTNKVITHVLSNGYNPEYECNTLIGRPSFHIYAKHWPVQVTWDPQDFQENACIKGAMLVGHLWPFFNDDWFLIEELLDEAACLAVDSTLLRLDRESDFFSFAEEVDVEGGTIGLARGLFIMYRMDHFFGGICQAEETNSTDGIYDLTELDVYPNPVEDILQLGVTQSTKYQISNLDGKLLISGEGLSIDVTQFHAGVYLLQVDGFRPKKIIKF